MSYYLEEKKTDLALKNKSFYSPYFVVLFKFLKGKHY